MEVQEKLMELLKLIPNGEDELKLLTEKQKQDLLEELIRFNEEFKLKGNLKVDLSNHEGKGKQFKGKLTKAQKYLQDFWVFRERVQGELNKIWSGIQKSNDGAWVLSKDVLDISRQVNIFMAYFANKKWYQTKKKAYKRANQTVNDEEKRFYDGLKTRLKEQGLCVECYGYGKKMSIDNRAVVCDSCKGTGKSNDIES